jgi:quercetin 2,3-dioxygenase
MSADWRRVQYLIPPLEMSEGAGVRIRRTIGGPQQENLDPFLLLDQFRSDDANDYIAGFPDHPHRGFETVTYMLAGLMRHEDSSGEGGTLRPGGVQWMTAGRGIVHSEMPEQEEGLMAGFQLWVNLPADQKMCPPRYQNIEPEDVPEVVRDDGVKIRIVAGEAEGVRGAVDGIAIDPIYLHVTVPVGATLDYPVAQGHTALCFVIEGEAEIGGSPVPDGHAAVLADGDQVRVTNKGQDETQFLLLAGRPIGEPIARYGPFVMNTRAELQQAFSDFQNGKF